jgi:hypothetical protein
MTDSGSETLATIPKLTDREIAQIEEAVKPKIEPPPEPAFSGRAAIYADPGHALDGTTWKTERIGSTATNTYAPRGWPIEKWTNLYDRSVLYAIQTYHGVSFNDDIAIVFRYENSRVLGEVLDTDKRRRDYRARSKIGFSEAKIFGRLWKETVAPLIDKQLLDIILTD